MGFGLLTCQRHILFKVNANQLLGEPEPFLWVLMEWALCEIKNPY